MNSLQAMGLRVRALEVRVAEVETSFGESIYGLERKITKADLRWVKLMEHLGVPDVTEAEVDEALDAR